MLVQITPPLNLRQPTLVYSLAGPMLPPQEYTGYLMSDTMPLLRYFDVVMFVVE